MKTKLTVLFSIGSGLIVLDSIDPIHSIMLFLLAGVIPGTNIAVPAVDMMAAYATAFTMVILRLAFWTRLKPVFFPAESSSQVKSTARIAKQS